MAGSNLVVSATSTWNGKGLAAGSRQISTFESGVKRLGLTLGSVFALSKIEQFGKSAITAFAEDQKQIAILNNSLKNTGFGHLTDQVGDFISKLQLATGVADDQLRPAFQNLLLSTGSVGTAMATLNLAMDVSAGTGKDLSSVTAAMSKAYLGNTTSLSKLGGGLDKVLLKSGDMMAINERLSTLFSGDAAVAASTFSGQLDILARHADDAKESIGEHLVAAIAKLAGTDGIAAITGQLDGATTAANNLIDALGGIALGLQGLRAHVNDALENNSFLRWLSNNLVMGNKILPSYPTVATKGSTLFPPKTSGKSGPMGPNALSPLFPLRPEGPALPMGPFKLPKKTPAEIAAAKAKALADAKRLANEKLQAAQDKAKLAITKLANNFDMKRIQLNAVIANNADASAVMSAKAQLDLLNAQDELAKGTLAGANAALALANSGNNAAGGINKLHDATTDQITKAANSSVALDKLAYASMSSAAALAAAGAGSTAYAAAIAAGATAAYAASAAGAAAYATAYASALAAGASAAEASAIATTAAAVATAAAATTAAAAQSLSATFTSLGFATAELSAAFVKSAFDMSTFHENYGKISTPNNTEFGLGSQSGFASGVVMTPNNTDFGVGNQPGLAAAIAAANAATAAAIAAANAAAKAATIIIQTPAVITPTTIAPIVAVATDALARAGYTSTHSVGRVGWE